MKRSIVAAAVLSCLFVSAGVFSAEQDVGILTIKGAVVGNPCTFVDGKSEETVILKQISLSDINAGSDFQAMDKNSEQTRLLTISCPTINKNDHVNIRIISPSMEDSGFIGNQNTAGNSPENAGFMLTSTNDPGKIINNALNSITIPGEALAEGREYPIPLTVHYSRKATETQVGDVMATVRLEVSAD
ncbi:hypothetical protein GJV06_01710 [Enterobacteriaceae bacterium RIT691]|nr:hypothetical protein [Enterobacteriaceae bacterium RIT691]